MVFVKDGQEVVPGIQAMATPGHTVGHTVYMITSQGKTLCNSGDIAHHHILSMARPRKEFMFDTDGKQAVASRVQAFTTCWRRSASRCWPIISPGRGSAMSPSRATAISLSPRRW